MGRGEGRRGSGRDFDRVARVYRLEEGKEEVRNSIQSLPTTIKKHQEQPRLTTTNLR